MQKSKIEWLKDPRTGAKGYSCNPVKGICQHDCSYCYAMRMYRRFKWNPEIRFDYSELDAISKIKIVKDGGYYYPKVFMGSTHDLFGKWIEDEWIKTILLTVIQNPKIIFIFLTKNPKRYSDFDFPKNAWIGYSTTGSLYHEWDSKHKHNIKFISIEPMMGEMVNTAYLHDTQWVIIGAETGNRKDKVKLEDEWLYNALVNLDKVNIPTFIKDNAGGVWQDFPAKESYERTPKVTYTRSEERDITGQVNAQIR